MRWMIGTGTQLQNTRLKLRDSLDVAIDGFFNTDCQQFYRILAQRFHLDSENRLSSQFLQEDPILGNKNTMKVMFWPSHEQENIVFKSDILTDAEGS